MTRNRRGPLAGFRIIEMSALGPVPFAGMLLADLGADVVRVDRTGGNDLGFPMDEDRDIMARGKRSIKVDVRNESGRNVVLDLVASADVILEGMRPGAMERLGLGPDDCLARNPRIVYGRMTGWGQTGPMAQAAGHDVNYISLNGVLHSVGLEGGPPVLPINLVGDYGGGSMFLVTGVLAALLEAARTGKGKVIDAAMIDGSSYLMTAVHLFAGAGMWSPERGTNFLDSGAPFYAVYETKDGRYMSVGAIEPKFYADFIDGLGLDIASLPPPLDKRNWPEIRSAISGAFLQKTRDEWTGVFATRDACVTPVLSMDEALEHEHNRERRTFLKLDGTVRPNVAPRFEGDDLTADADVCLSGADTHEILGDLAYDQERIDRLVEQGVVAGTA